MNHYTNPSLLIKNALITLGAAMVLGLLLIISLNKGVRLAYADSSTPTNLTATGGTTNIRLQWVAPANNLQLGYDIQRSLSPNSNFAHYAGVPKTATVYQDSGVVAGTLYYYKIRAQTGSNPITYSAFTSVVSGALVSSCTFSISPTSVTFTSASSATSTVSVTTQSGCNWTASTTAAFASFPSGTSGSGNGTITYSLSDNLGVTRTAVFRIAGATFTATQEGSVMPPIASSTLPAFTNTGPFTVGIVHDQVYGIAPVSPSGTTDLKMDLYYPANVQLPLSALPVIVYIHGGGWYAGDKADCFSFDYSTATQTSNTLCADQAARGYVVASINYRLSGQAIFPAQIQDVKGAIRYLRANANTFATINGGNGFIMDPARIATFGVSAGGHLTSLLATSAGVANLEGDLNPGYDSSIQAAVPFFGPTDLTQMDAELTTTFGAGHFIPHNSSTSPESLLLGCTLGDPTCNSTVASVANPITYVTSAVPPMLLRHGSRDRTVPSQQSQLLYNALSSAGTYADLGFLTDTMIPNNIDHGFQNNICTTGEGNANPNPQFSTYLCSDVARAAYKDAAAFIDHVLRGL